MLLLNKIEWKNILPMEYEELSTNRATISFDHFKTVTDATLTMSELNALIRRFDFYFDPSKSVNIDIDRLGKSINQLDQEDYFIKKTSNAITALRRILRLTTVPISRHINPYIEGRMYSYRYYPIVEEGPNSRLLDDPEPTLDSDVYNEKEISKPAYNNENETTTTYIQKKMSSFVRKMTWFQYSALLEFKYTDNVNSHSKNSGKEALKLPISCLPLALFITLSPQTIKSISELGRNDVSQKTITTYFNTKTIKSITSAVRNMNGEILISLRRSIIDLYSHFSKTIISALVEVSDLFYDFHNYHDDSDVPFEEFYWLNMDIFTNIADIGNQAKVPLFKMDTSFLKWYNQNILHFKDVTIKRPYSNTFRNQINLYTNSKNYYDGFANDSHHVDMYPFLYPNNYCSWETESYLLNKKILNPIEPKNMYNDIF